MAHDDHAVGFYYCSVIVVPFYDVLIVVDLKVFDLYYGAPFVTNGPIMKVVGAKYKPLFFVLIFWVVKDFTSHDPKTKLVLRVISEDMVTTLKRLVENIAINVKAVGDVALLA